MSEDEPHYVKTQEIMRYANEIGRQINDRQPSFAAVKKLILESAAVKFTVCRENRAEAYTDYVCDLLEGVDESEIMSVPFLRKIVGELRLNGKNKLSVVFVNGAEIGSGEIR